MSEEKLNGALSIVVAKRAAPVFVIGANCIWQLGFLPIGDYVLQDRQSLFSSQKIWNLGYFAGPQSQQSQVRKQVSH
jgi:hypothetical protein